MAQKADQRQSGKNVVFVDNENDEEVGASFEKEEKLFGELKEREAEILLLKDELSSVLFDYNKLLAEKKEQQNKSFEVKRINNSMTDEVRF